MILFMNFLLSEVVSKTIICIVICIVLLYLVFAVFSIISAFSYRNKIKSCYKSFTIIIFEKIKIIQELHDFLNKKELINKKFEYDIQKNLLNKTYSECYMDLIKIYNDLLSSLRYNDTFKEIKNDTLFIRILKFNNETDIQYFKLLENYNYVTVAYNYYVKNKLTILWMKIFKLKPKENSF